MRALLVLNEKARRGAREGSNVCRTLVAMGVACERDPDSRGIDVVVAAGGDGTVISAVPIAMARNVPLAIVPLGTFNDLARVLDIPATVYQACETIVQGYSRRIDVGRVNGVYFVNEASVGLSTRMARNQTPEAKQRFGVMGIVPSIARSLRAVRPFFVEVAYDDRVERFHTIQLTIANSGCFGGIILRADASVDDGWLDLYSLEPANWLQALHLAFKIILHGPTSQDGLRTRRSARFAVHTHRPHHISADGEPAGKTPALFEILCKAIEVIVPNPTACSIGASAAVD